MVSDKCLALLQLVASSRQRVREEFWPQAAVLYGGDNVAPMMDWSDRVRI